MAENTELNTDETDFITAWQQATDEDTVTSAIENMRRAEVFARGAEMSLANVAERYLAAGNTAVATTASQAASHCRQAMDALRQAQETVAGYPRTPNVDG